MATWQITGLTSMLLFIIGALLMIVSHRKRTMLEGYAAWFVAIVVMAIGFYSQPQVLNPLLGSIAGMRDSITNPPVVVAILCLLVVTVRVIEALLEKNAALFGTTEDFGEVRLGMLGPQPEPRRSALPRLMDRFRKRTQVMPEVREAPGTRANIASNGGSAWSSMLKNERICDAFGITPEEQEMLAQVSFMGKVSSPHDLRLVLDGLRAARAKIEAEAAADAKAGSVARSGASTRSAGK